MAENTTTSGRQRTSRQGFVERHRQALFALSLVVGGLILSLGLIFLILAISVGTEPPGTRFASATDRYVVGGAALVAFAIGNYIVYRGFKLAGW